jgi:hypothetical protein
MLAVGPYKRFMVIPAVPLTANEAGGEEPVVLPSAHGSRTCSSARLVIVLHLLAVLCKLDVMQVKAS